MSKSKYYEFLNPNYIYVPFNDRSLLNIKLNTYVFNNQILGKLSNNSNIYSTCSGKLIDLKSIETIDGRMNSIVIENDFREKRKKLVGMKRNLSSYTKEDMIEKLNDYSLNFFKDIDNLIVLVEYSKNIDNSDYYTLCNNIDCILELIDALNVVLNIKNCIIVTNSKDSNSYEVLNNYIGTYPNIGLSNVSKEYNESEYSLLKKKLFKNENNTLVLTLDKIYEIYYVLKKNKVITSKVISVCYLKELINVNVKINTSVSELLNYLDIKANKVMLKKDVIKQVSVENSIITKEVKAIIVK